jgi:hypothetical protein
VQIGDTVYLNHRVAAQKLDSELQFSIAKDEPVAIRDSTIGFAYDYYKVEHPSGRWAWVQTYEVREEP